MKGLITRLGDPVYEIHPSSYLIFHILLGSQKERIEMKSELSYRKSLVDKACRVLSVCLSFILFQFFGLLLQWIERLAEILS